MMDAEEISEWYHTTIMELEKLAVEELDYTDRYVRLQERAAVLKVVMENGTRHD